MQKKKRKRKKKHNSKNWLFVKGIPIKTQFVDIRKNTSIDLNGRSPYRVVTKGYHPMLNQEMEFYSENIWENISSANIKPGREFIVYFDPNWPKVYSIDIEFLKPYS